MEEWRAVHGYEGYYEVSRYGDVRSLDRYVVKSDGVTQHRRGKPCCIFYTYDGYAAVKLSRNGKTVRRYVHRVVYEAFCGSIPDGYEINHIDFDRLNNNIDNLEAVTHLDNIRKTYNAGRHVSQIKDFSGASNPNYGNKSLSMRYAADGALSKAKQSRPGAQNGRSKAVMIHTSECDLVFDTISDCAAYMISSGLTASKLQNAAVNISLAAKNNRQYLGCTFEFI